MSCPFEAMKEQLKTGVRVVSAPQLFVTPSGLAGRMAYMLDINKFTCILEPSAGTGVLIDAVRAYHPEHITACEINNDLAKMLLDKVNILRQCDFLEMELGEAELFDAVIMNPPFKNGEDIKHIKHALSMLREGGQLVAICAGGPRQERELQPLCDTWERLPAGTFKQSGTGVNTVLLSLRK